MDGVKTKENNSKKYFSYQIMTAVFFVIVSSSLELMNKSVLSVYNFPVHVLAFTKMLDIIVVLFLLNLFKQLQFCGLNMTTFKIVFPLSVIGAAEFVSGLAGTRLLTVPVFSSLQKITIPMTMYCEWAIFKIKPGIVIQLCVYAIVIGALTAAFNDWSFSVLGFVILLFHDFSIAATTLYTKNKLDTTDIGVIGLIFYCSLFMIVPIAVIAWFTGDIRKLMEFEHWTNPWFLGQFLLTTCLGVLWHYSMLLCTKYNSALTTLVVGSVKNILLAYIGMFTDFSYIFNWWNFIGINICTLGAAVYICYVFKNQRLVDKEVKKDKLLADIESENGEKVEFAKNILGFDLSAHFSDISDNRVVTGVRFVNIDGIISIQIQDGKLENGCIDPNSIKWNYNIGHPPKDGFRFVKLNEDFKFVFLDDIILSNDMLVTGIKFVVNGKYLDINVAGVSKYNRISKSDKVQWFSSTKVETKTVELPRLDMISSDDVRNPELEIAVRYYVKFKTENFQEAGENEALAIRLNEVVMKPTIFVEGIGICYKKDKNSAGIISLKLISNIDV